MAASPIVPVLTTERLILRPFRRDDLGDLLAYALASEFRRYLPLPEQTPATVAAFLDGCLARLAEPDPARREFGIELPAAGRLVGAVRVAVTDRAHGAGDLGWELNPGFRGRGYAAEAARAVLAFGFDDLGLHRVWATADVRNGRSWRVMERIGMRREGVMRGDKIVRGERRDSVLYAILATDPRP